jgi:hypothetical protein
MDAPVKCCEQPENLKVIESTLSKTVQQCTVCGRKHYEFVADPLHLNLKAH